MKGLTITAMFLMAVFALCSPAFAQEAESAGANGIPSLWWITFFAPIIALIFAYFFYKKVMAEEEGTEQMISIAGHVREGAYAYLYSQYKVVFLVFVILRKICVD